jgi:hypothetical protein
LPFYHPRHLLFSANVKKFRRNENTSCNDCDSATEREKIVLSIFCYHNPVLSPAKAVEYPKYVGFLQHFALPNAHLFNVLVPYGEFLVGLGYKLNRID